MDTQEQTGRYRILNRDAIKYIAKIGRAHV